MTSLSSFSARGIDGADVDLSEYAGQVVLVVNTASQCGFTPQYQGLQGLYDDFASRGFTVLGFPCDQFAHQEPGDEGEIASFCERNFGVSFPLFAKIDVNGPETHPVFDWLKGEKKGLLGGRINWNFTKFLVGRDGAVLRRYSPKTTPESIRDDVEAALAAPAGGTP
ncbi:glutathione peroxidase [Nocardioides bruguierae]|uniref:Glutathione peroxidase n=1 Tax=Nocardioides bruguierae TaxID=2945102 RepID=A0A9X2D7Z6_9ACTN|nr:glutathione peroxidase [Nocardioides bruguierae]MCM0621030.1 glutathione peroxidase [Nocardioides bruguierae]